MGYLVQGVIVKSALQERNSSVDFMVVGTSKDIEVESVTKKFLYKSRNLINLDGKSRTRS